jgi:hypothetical protein
MIPVDGKARKATEPNRIDRVRVASDISPEAIQTFVACHSGAFQNHCFPFLFMSFRWLSDSSAIMKSDIQYCTPHTLKEKRKKKGGGGGKGSVKFL